MQSASRMEAKKNDDYRVKARYTKGELTLSLLRKAAIDEITEKGYFRAGVASIVQRASLTRGAFYNYWHSLDECLLDILSTVREDLLSLEVKEYLNSQFAFKSATVRRVFSALTIMLRCNHRPSYLTLALLQEKDLPSAILRDTLRIHLNEIIDDYAKTIADDQDAGFIAENIDSRGAACGIVNLIGGLMHIHELRYDEIASPMARALGNYLAGILIIEEPESMRDPFILINSLEIPEKYLEKGRDMPETIADISEKVETAESDESETDVAAE